jgi:hypothetical protein
MKPIIFSRANIKFPSEFKPSVLIAFDYQYLAKLNNKQKEPINEIEFYDFFWFETDVMGALCSFTPEDQNLFVVKFNAAGETIGRFEKNVAEKAVNSYDSMSVDDKMCITQIMFGLYLMTQARLKKRQSVFTAQRNKASVYYREGDVVKWKRIFNMSRLPSPEYCRPEPGSSGIKKKQHDVIGHYRRYKNGAKVWVNPHKRGNPELGIVTKLITD